MNAPWCPWCFDGEPANFLYSAKEVEVRLRVGDKVLSWACRRCCVSLITKRWAAAMTWAARFHGLEAEMVAPDIERALGEAA